MNIKRLMTAAAISGALALSSTAAYAASVLYGITGAGGASSNLYTVDTATGAATLIGDTGIDGFTAMDFDPLSGALYGVTGSSGGGQSLYTIDTITGAASLIAAVSPISFGPPDITFTSDGTLFGWTETGDDLITIDKVTGAITTIPSSLGTFQTGIAADSTDTLYVKAGSSVYTVDAGTGAATSVGSITGTMGTLHNLLAIDGSDTAFTYGRGTGLFSFDLGTLGATFIGDSGHNFSALAFSNEPAPVPLPATGLFLIAGLGALGASRRRKAKPKA